MDSTQLGKFADDVLRDGQGADDIVAALDKYASAFDEWFRVRENLFSGAEPGANIEELKQIIEQHNKVLNVAQNLKGKTALDLKSLRQRGKSIIAYTDHLPKRVSLHAPRKG